MKFLSHEEAGQVAMCDICPDNPNNPRSKAKVGDETPCRFWVQGHSCPDEVALYA